MKRVRPLILDAAVVIASLVAVLTLAGCGSAKATPDPFLGTCDGCELGAEVGG